jgi:dipeptidyl-peptidase 4
MTQLIAPRRILACVMAFGLLAPFALAGDPATPWPDPCPPELQTVAEKSAYRATSTHAEAVQQLDAVVKASKWATRLSMGTTTEGKEIPVAVFAVPPVKDAADARARSANGVATVLIFGNIHAGEVDGKEAIGMLARELGLPPDASKPDEPHPLLKKLVIAIAPIYNGDGNDKFGPIETTRPGQVGPADGAGQRHNAMDLDLNRDFVKMEAPETRGLVGFMNAWDPLVIVDAHTTNGSFHQYLITYAGPKVPAGDSAFNHFAREIFMPAVATRYEQTTGLPTFWYGSFRGTFSQSGAPDKTGWETFPPEPRFGTNAIGMRNRVGILSESYSHSEYKDRILGTLAFCRAVLAETAARVPELQRATADADARALQNAGKDLIIRTKTVAWPEKVLIRGWVEEAKDGRVVPTNLKKSYLCDLYDRFESEKTVTMPEAYVLTRPMPAVEEVLAMQGIQTRRLQADVELDAQRYVITKATPASREFQKHVLVSIDANTVPAKVRLAKGSVVIPVNQRLGRFAAYILEPASEDGLAAWNFFDAWLRVAGAPGSTDDQEAYPLVRVESLKGMSLEPAK